MIRTLNRVLLFCCNKIKNSSYNSLGDFMLKKGFQILGIISIICFSFFCTEKAVMVIREQDSIMQEIISLKDKYNIEPIEASLIDKYYVIPGYNGIKIDIEKSYNSMKRLNKFNDTLLVYEEYKPKLSINNIYDRYIIQGNKVKNMVALIFKVDENDDITTLLELLDKNDTKVTFFIDGRWLNDNIDKVKEIIKQGHEVANYGYEHKYSNDFLVWTNNKLKQMNKKRSKYCYVEEDDMLILNLCQNYRMHTIKPTIIAKNYPYSEVKDNLIAGSIISFDITDTVLRELRTIIMLIKNKGYKIKILSEHLSEKRE